MLHHLMVATQDYLVLSDDDNQRGAQPSLELVRSTARTAEDNRICIWLEDVWQKVSEVCVETTVVVDTLGPARHRTYGLCVTVRCSDLYLCTCRIDKQCVYQI